MSATAYGWLVLASPLAGMILIALGWRVLPGRSAGWLAALAILSDPALLEGVRERAGELRVALDGHRGIAEVRGRGLMVGVGLADGVDAREVARAALAAGLMVNAPNPSTIRLLPPLTITAGDLAQGLGQLLTALDGCVPQRA